MTTGNVGKFEKKSGIRAYQQQMKLLLEKMTLQMAGNGEAQRKLQADLRNKKLAHEIDKFVIVENSHLNKLKMFRLCKEMSNRSQEKESHSRIQVLSLESSNLST